MPPPSFHKSLFHTTNLKSFHGQLLSTSICIWVHVHPLVLNFSVEIITSRKRFQKQLKKQKSSLLQTSTPWTKVVTIAHYEMLILGSTQGFATIPTHSLCVAWLDVILQDFIPGIKGRERGIGRGRGHGGEKMWRTWSRIKDPELS